MTFVTIRPASFYHYVKEDLKEDDPQTVDAVAFSCYAGILITDD